MRRISLGALLLVSLIAPSPSFGETSSVDLIETIRDKGGQVYRSDCEGFPPGVNATYDPEANTITLCHHSMYRWEAILRHEAIHMAQDCKAGLKNNRLEVLLPRAPWPENEYTQALQRVYHGLGRSEHWNFEREAFGLQDHDNSHIIALLEAYCR